MYKGTTPTIILTLPEGVDLSDATGVYVSIAKHNGAEIVRKTNDELVIDEDSISVWLSQEETLSFPEYIDIQVNWTFAQGDRTQRAASKIATFKVKNNIINQVLQ